MHARVSYPPYSVATGISYGNGSNLSRSIFRVPPVSSYIAPSLLCSIALKEVRVLCDVPLKKGNAWLRPRQRNARQVRELTDM